MDVGNDGSDEVAYTYTGDLKRVWRHESGELKNTYKWDAGFNVVQETYWSGGSATMTKAYAGGLAEVDVTSTPSYSYPTWDHLGSTRGMWDGSIGQLGSWEYTPYGSPYLFAGPSDVTQLFTGHDLDPVTGKYYAPFRYLDPEAGRWLKRDPLGMIDGPNMYAYARLNPTIDRDLLGLWVGGMGASGSASLPGLYASGGGEWLVGNDDEFPGDDGQNCFGLGPSGAFGVGLGPPGVQANVEAIIGGGNVDDWGGGGWQAGGSICFGSCVGADIERSDSGRWRFKLSVGIGTPTVEVHAGRTGTWWWLFEKLLD